MNKKTMIAISALCAAVAFQASAVESGIVGYQTINLQGSKYVALAVQFENVSEATDIAVKDLLTIANPAGAGGISTSADQIWRWNTIGNDWDKYFYRSGRGVSTPGWCKSGETTITTDTIAAGETCFVYRGGSTSTTATLSGGVKVFTGSSTYSVPASSYVFMGYPWPVAFQISTMANTYASGSPAGAGGIATSADQIWRWDTTGNDWVKYFYRSGRGVTTPGWCKAGETTITADTIPAGEGFFFYRGGSSAVTIQFTYEE